MRSIWLPTAARVLITASKASDIMMAL